MKCNLEEKVNIGLLVLDFGVIFDQLQALQVVGRAWRFEVVLGTAFSVTKFGAIFPFKNV